MKKKDWMIDKIFIFFLLISTYPNEISLTFVNPEVIQSWEKRGNIQLRSDVLFQNTPTLFLGPGSHGIWKVQDYASSGEVKIWVKENLAKPDNPQERYVGPRWGIIQPDGRVLVVGILYAPYLDKGASYVIVDSDQKTWFNLQYIGEKRDDKWNEWKFTLIPEKGIYLSRNGREIKRFDWNKTKIEGWNGVIVYGDMDVHGKHEIWVGQIEIKTGGPMQIKPIGNKPELTKSKENIVPLNDPNVTDPVQLLSNVASIHPRLLFGREELAQMHNFLKTSHGQNAWEKLSTYVKTSTVPKNEYKFLRDATDGQRVGLWQAPSVGLYYLLTGDLASKQKAIDYLSLFVQLEHWEEGEEEDAGMSSANIAIGAALLYDWLYEELEPPFREQARNKLLLMARRQYYHGHLNLVKSVGYWQNDPQNNHRWHRNAGLTLLTLAVADQNRQDYQWLLTQVKNELDYVWRWLPEDGTSHEGPSYLIFGLPHLILAMQSADRCLGTQYLSHPFFKQVALFSITSLCPGLQSSFAFGDGRGGLGNYANALYKSCELYPQEDLLDGLIHVSRIHPKSFWLGWMDIIWMYKIQGWSQGDYRRLPRFNFWPDIGVVYCRDQWEESGRGAMFKCGPMGGYLLNRYRNQNNFRYINIAHDDFDANSFILFKRKEFVAETDGYSYKKESANHNTILVNGKGQMVEGRMTEGIKWNQPGSGDMSKMAVITTYKEFPYGVIVEGEASGSYPVINKGKDQRPALQRYRRTFIWMDRRYVLVIDDILAEKPICTSWLIQAPQDIRILDPKFGKYQLMGKEEICEFFVDSNCPPRQLTVTNSPADDRGKVIGHKQLRYEIDGSEIQVVSLYNLWDDHQLNWQVEWKNHQIHLLIKGKHGQDQWCYQRRQGLWIPSQITLKTSSESIEITERDIPLSTYQILFKN